MFKVELLAHATLATLQTNVNAFLVTINEYELQDVKFVANAYLDTTEKLYHVAMVTYKVPA